MFIHVFFVDQDIIKENKYNTTKEGFEYLIHERLKSGRGISQAERHGLETRSGPCACGKQFWGYWQLALEFGGSLL